MTSKKCIYSYIQIFMEQTLNRKIFMSYLFIISRSHAIMYVSYEEILRDCKILIMTVAKILGLFCT